MIGDPYDTDIPDRHAQSETEMPVETYGVQSEFKHIHLNIFIFINFLRIYIGMMAGL